MDRGYKVEFANDYDFLTAREKVMLKETQDAISIDEQTQATEEQSFVIDYAYHVALKIHNEKAEDKDYLKFIIVDKNGVKYATGSENLICTLEDIVDEMTDAGEGDNIKLKFFRRDSKNYKGKQFLTCALV